MAVDPRLKANIRQRFEGEHLRVDHALDTLKAAIESTQIGLKSPVPIGFELGQTLTETASRIATTLARMDVLQRILDDMEDL